MINFWFKYNIQGCEHCTEISSVYMTLFLKSFKNILTFIRHSSDDIDFFLDNHLFYYKE